MNRTEYHKLTLTDGQEVMVAATSGTSVDIMVEEHVVTKDEILDLSKKQFDRLIKTAKTPTGNSDTISHRSKRK